MDALLRFRSWRRDARREHHPPLSQPTDRERHARGIDVGVRTATARGRISGGASRTRLTSRSRCALDPQDRRQDPLSPRRDTAAADRNAGVRLQVAYQYRSALRLIRKAAVTSAADSDGRQLRRVIDTTNTAGDVWADSAYRSAKNEALLKSNMLKKPHPSPQAQG